MNDLEKELTELLRNESGFEGSTNESTRKEMAQMILQKFELDMFQVKIVFWIFLIVSAAMMVGGMIFLTREESTRGMLFSVVVAMIGYNSTVLMKLWYWVVSTKLGILKELKQLQLQVSELTEEEPPSEA
jgi:hypothetical protein